MRLPLPIEASYDSTRRDVDEQRTVNLIPHSSRGWRQFPGFTQWGDSASVSTTWRDDFDVSGQFGAFALRGSWINYDGTNLYASNNTQIFQYALGTSFDVSTATYNSKTVSLTSVGFAEGTHDFAVSPDGTKYFQLDFTTAQIEYGTMSVAWDISTLTYDGVYSITNGSNSSGMHLAYNGAYLFHGDLNADFIYRLTFGTAFDGSTLTYGGAAADSFSTTGRHTEGDIRGVDFDINGTEMRLLDGTSGDVSTQRLTTEWDLSTVGSENLLGITTSTQAYSLNFRDGGERFYFSDRTNSTIDEYARGGKGRGLKMMGGILYAVIGPTLYSFDSNGAGTSRGTILNQPSVCHMETDGTQLVICTSSTIYTYTVAGGLVVVTDGDIEDTANTSAYLDLKFFFDQSAGSFIASANNDATSFSLDDKAEAESFGDDLLGVFGHNQLLYLLGSTSIEVWYTSGVGRPPVDRQQVIERGLIGSAAISSIDDTIYFVDQERRVNRMSGLEYARIPAKGLDKEIMSYDVVSDCSVVAYSVNRENLVDFRFPSAETTWTLHEASGKWTKREDSYGDAYNAIGYANGYGLTILLDKTNGKLYTMSNSTYQDDLLSMTRTKDIFVTSEIYGEPGLEGKDMICNELILTFDTSAAATVTVTLSKDGGAFAQSRTLTLTSGVQSRKLTQFGRFREGIFRITTTSNARVDLVDAAADLEVLRG